MKDKNQNKPNPKPNLKPKNRNKKKIKITNITLLFTFFSLVLSLITAYFIPHIFYFLLVTGQLSQYIVNQLQIEKMWVNGKKDFLSYYGENVISEKYWQSFQMSNYKILLPVHHPMINVIPTVSWEKSDPDLKIGFKFNTPAHKTLVEVTFYTGIPFKRLLVTHPLWKLPVFIENLENVDIDKIWKDIFIKKLPIDADTIIRQEWWETIYNIYILYMRNCYFPKSTSTYYYNESMNHSVVLYTPDNGEDDYYYEKVYFFILGQVEYYEIKYLDNNADAQDIRNRIINTTSYSGIDLSLSKTQYGVFQALPFENKIAEEGMYYLFSAWSQTTEDKELLREIILFLERGNDHLEQLQYIYNYAYKRYGPQFVSKKARDDQNTLGDQNSKNDVENGTQLALPPEGNSFKNDQEQTKYYLKKIKAKSENKNENKNENQNRSDKIIFD